MIKRNVQQSGYLTKSNAEKPSANDVSHNLNLSYDPRQWPAGPDSVVFRCVKKVEELPSNEVKPTRYRSKGCYQDVIKGNDAA